MEVKTDSSALSDAPRARGPLRRLVGPVLVLAALVAAAWFVRRTFFVPEPVAVRTVAVERGRVEASVANSKAGSVRARRQAKLAPSASGPVVELSVHRGDRVAAGDVLIRLDDSVQRASLVRAERALAVLVAQQAQACIVSERAARELARNKELAATGLVSVDRLDSLQSELDVATGECAVLQAQVERGKAEIDVARAELAHTVLRAPFDGVVAEVTTELGEWIAPAIGLVSMPTVIEVFDPASLYVAAPMDEVDSARLQRGAPARVTIDSHPGRRFEATIVHVAPYVLDVEQQNRTVEIEVELADREIGATLLPGTSADVEVILDARPDVLRLPTSTLLEGSRVLVVQDGVLAERTVTTGLRNWDFTEILTGLDEGARVVSSLDLPGVEAGRSALVDAAPPRP
jgi:HlyD family secretion protein